MDNDRQEEARTGEELSFSNLETSTETPTITDTPNNIETPATTDTPNNIEARTEEPLAVPDMENNIDTPNSFDTPTIFGTPNHIYTSTIFDPPTEGESFYSPDDNNSNEIDKSIVRSEDEARSP